MLGDSVRRRNPGQRPPKNAKPPSLGEGRPRLRWKVWAPALLAALMLPFLIGYAIAVWLLFPAPEVALPGIQVPVLRGMSLVEARQALAAAGLGELEARMLPHPDAAEGTIVAQAPLAGQQLRRGASMRVAVSSGVPRVVIPDVVGFQSARARGLLQRLGLEVVEEEEESAVEQGRVVRSEPIPGERVALPATVRLTISIGLPEPVDSLGFPIDTLTTPSDTSAIPRDTTGTSAVRSR